MINTLTLEDIKKGDYIANEFYYESKLVTTYGLAISAGMETVNGITQPEIQCTAIIDALGNVQINQHLGIEDSFVRYMTEDEIEYYNEKVKEFKNTIPVYQNINVFREFLEKYETDVTTEGEIVREDILDKFNELFNEGI